MGSNKQKLIRRLSTEHVLLLEQLTSMKIITIFQFQLGLRWTGKQADLLAIDCQLDSDVGNLNSCQALSGLDIC